MKRFSRFTIAALTLLMLGHLILLVSDGAFLRAWGVLLLWCAPGLLWGEVLLNRSSRLAALVFGCGFGYAYTLCLTLLLSYLPGPLPLWAEVIGLDLFAIAALSLPLIARHIGKPSSLIDTPSQNPFLGLVIILLVFITLVGALFRFTWLDYSEFQGDEALVMLAAADVLEGHEDVLLLRGKGPAEVLLPTALWGLTGTIDEATARLPFALAGTLIPLLGFLLATSLFEDYRMATGIGVATAALLALNGFMVAFSRIVQYQVLVMFMSGLALWCSWQWRRDGSVRWLVLCGFFLGSALLAHYDGLMAFPAIIYVIATAWRRRTGREERLRSLVHTVAASAMLCLVIGLFYLPYGLDVQAMRTGDYLGDRIGSASVKNNLASFQHFNVFYTSFYYYALTGLLVLGFLVWVSRDMYGLRRLRQVSRWFPVVLGLAVVVLLCWPETLRTSVFDLAFVPFALLFFGALGSASLNDGQRAVVLWLAVPFLGYNFAVALPLTHIYTIVPAWTLLAGLASIRIAPHIALSPGTTSPWRRWRARLTVVLVCVIATLFVGYLALAYLCHDVEFVADWPRSHTALYWTPYSDPPFTGFFGFPHRSGWKAVGALYSSGKLQGDYSSNEEPDITAWYTRNAPRACDAYPEYYFIASDVVDMWPVDVSKIHKEYEIFAEITLSNGKGLKVYRARPTGATLGPLSFEPLATAFDRTAVPSAFARAAHIAHQMQVDLENLVRLRGYDLDDQRAYPGGRLTVTLYWQALTTIGADYHVFVHLEQGSSIWAQSDGRPICWTYPTYVWRPGQLIADHHALHIRTDTPPGEYPILVGMYRPDDGQRLEVLDATGHSMGNAIHLTTVTVRAQ